MKIHCCKCGYKVDARLTNGTEIYPHRKDLANLPFWKCDACGLYVGCHHKDKSNPTLPLGVMVTKDVKNARMHIHKILDPIWQSHKMPRGKIYAILTKKLGWEYHTANIRSIDEARKVYRLVKELSRNL